MTTIKIETETIETDLTPTEAAELIKEALGIKEFPQKGNMYLFVDDWGDAQTSWDDDPADHYRLAHGNCAPTKEGLAQYKADMAKYAAIVAIRKHRDKTFGVFEPEDGEERVYGNHYQGDWVRCVTTATFSGVTIPFSRTPTSNAHSQSAGSIGRC